MNAKTITAILFGGALLLSARTASADDTSAGLGAFVQLELLQHVGDEHGHAHDHDGHDFHAFLGAGVQWWF